jgi:hypothetical protein
MTRDADYLLAALDNLGLWADVVAPKVFIEGRPVAISARPHFTLARAGLESGAQAAWVLAGGLGPSRTRRP